MNSVRAGYKMTELGEIPSDWDFKSLKDICYIKGRIGWQGLRKDEFISEGPYLITGINFDRGKIIWNECYHITNERYEQAPEIQLKVGDVLMTKDGTIGKLLYVDNLPDKASLNSHLFVMRPINDSFISKYFYYHLQSEKFKKYIDNNKTGSTMPAITQAAMEKYKLILPPLEEQEKIASILSTVDEQIDNVEALIKKNKELKKGLMQTLLTKGIGHTKFKKTEIGEIPEEWEIKTIEQISNIVGRIGFRGYNKTDIVEKGKGAITIGPSNIENNKFIEDNLTYLSWEKYYESPEIQVENGDILLVKTASVGKVIYIEGLNKKATINPQLVILKNIKCNAKYLYYTMINSKFQSDIKKASAGGVMLTLTHGNINSIKIALPRLDEQEKIALILSEIDEKIEGYENKKQKLEELKKGLMQQLLTGKIRAI